LYIILVIEYYHCKPMRGR